MAQFVYTSYEPNSIIIVVCSVLNSSPAWANYSLLIVTYCGETRGQDRQIHSSGTLPPHHIVLCMQVHIPPPISFRLFAPQPDPSNCCIIVVELFDDCCVNV